jgi:hypothetical protein
MAQRSIQELAQRRAELIAELSDVRAEIAARAGQVDAPATPKRTTRSK